MKKGFLVLLIAMLAWSCSNDSKNQKASQEKTAGASQEEAVKKDYTVTLSIDGKTIRFDNVSFQNGAPNPGVKSDRWDIYGSVKDDKESTINFEFEAAAPTTIDKVYCNIKGYNVTQAKLVIEQLKTRMAKNSYGVPLGPEITDFKATFSGKARKYGSNGMPTNEVVDFSGSIE